MLRRNGITAIAACAALTSAAAVATAAEPDNSSDSLLSLTPTVYADTAPPARKPLMNLLDKVGIAKGLDELNLNIGGYIQGGITLNCNDPGDGVNVGRSFDFEDRDPTLNQWNIFIERTVDASKGKFDVGGRVEWIWGSDARFLHSNGLNFYGPVNANVGVQDGPNEQFDLTQCYLTFAVPVGTGLTVTAGKFVTLLGYEYINPTQNALYSHSYLFGFAIPFTNTGVIGKYNINDKTTFTFGFSRGWEQTLKDNNAAIDVLWQVTYNLDDKTSFAFTGICGPEGDGKPGNYRTVLDFIGTYKMSDNLSFAINGDYGYGSSEAADGDTGQWYGIAGYATYILDSHFAFTGRLEWFNDNDGARGLGSTVYEGTIGVSIKPLPENEWASGLSVRPELRWDHSDDNIFNDGNDSNQYTFGADILYAY